MRRRCASCNLSPAGHGREYRPLKPQGQTLPASESQGQGRHRFLLASRSGTVAGRGWGGSELIRKVPVCVRDASLCDHCNLRNVSAIWLRWLGLTRVVLLFYQVMAVAPLATGEGRPSFRWCWSVLISQAPIAVWWDCIDAVSAPLDHPESDTHTLRWLVDGAGRRAGVALAVRCH